LQRIAIDKNLKKHPNEKGAAGNDEGNSQEIGCICFYGIQSLTGFPRVASRNEAENC
jgi:hypothetical protein